MKKNIILIAVVALAVVASGCQSGSSTNKTDTSAAGTQNSTGTASSGGQATAPGTSSSTNTQTPTGASTTPAANQGNTGGQAASPAPSASTGQQKSQQPAPPPKPANPVQTPKQFDDVSYGMSLAEVQKVVGSDGKLSNENTGDDSVKVYDFKLKDGATMKVTFKNDKVLSKSTSN